MEHSRHVEDESSSDERDPKRHMSDNAGSTACEKEAFKKNVVLLVGSDVQKKDGKVYMPNNKEMVRLKGLERGQFKKDVKFTKTMTEKDVEEELRHHFPILRNYDRYSCYSCFHFYLNKLVLKVSQKEKELIFFNFPENLISYIYVYKDESTSEEDITQKVIWE